jgi:hypothetical protein
MAPGFSHLDLDFSRVVLRAQDRRTGENANQKRSAAQQQG